MNRIGNTPFSRLVAWPTAARTGWEWAFRLSPVADSVTLSIDAVDRRLRRTQKMARVETALLVADGPTSTRKLMQAATLADISEADALIEALNQAYDLSGSPFRIERVATGYQLLTRPEFAHWLGRLHQRQADLKLSPAALETLTILAYRQPLTRADLEAVRGVQCTDILKLLMDRGLVRIAGEDNTLGRPFLYETTRKFLETYGLRSLEDLPRAGELRVRRSSNESASVETDAA